LPKIRVLLVASLFLTLSAPTPVAAGDPLPVQEPAHSKVDPQTGVGTEVATQTSTTFGVGDVFVAIGGGKVQWRLPDGTLNAVLDTGLGGYTTGMAFDKETGDLFVTGFTANAVIGAIPRSTPRV
jgi:hypothetical protein